MIALRQTLRALAALATAAVLSACGGGGADPAASLPAAGGGTAAPDSSDGTSPGADSGVSGTGASGGTSGSIGAGTGGTTGAPAAGGTTGTGASGTTGSGTGGTTTPPADGTTAPPAGGGTTGTGTGGTTSPPGGGTGTPPSAVDVIASSGTLQTSISPPSYPSGSAGGNALAALNLARTGAGAGLLNQSTQLDVAAGAHATYLSTNIGAVGHSEDATKFAFYDVSAADRVAKAGFAASSSIETLSTAGTLLGGDCVKQLLNSVYNAVALLSPATYAGFGFGANFATTPVCAGVLATSSNDAYGQVPGASALVTYPYDGQTQVLESFGVDSESPRMSIALLPNATAGTPVIANVRNADYVNFEAAGVLSAIVGRFALKDQGGNLVPAVILANPSLHAEGGVALVADANLPAGAAVLIPLSPLVRGQTYTAEFSATLKTAGAVLEKTWSFTTQP